MNLIMRIFSALRFIGTFFLVMHFSTAAIADGKTLYSSNGCEGCHGTAGSGSVGPRLAGQQEKYLVEQFKLIRDGKRTSGLATMMGPAVSGVNDDDIKVIANYLSRL